MNLNKEKNNAISTSLLKALLIADIFAFIDKITDAYIQNTDAEHSTLFCGLGLSWQKTKQNIVIVKHDQLKSHRLIQGLAKYNICINQVLLEQPHQFICMVCGCFCVAQLNSREQNPQTKYSKPNKNKGKLCFHPGLGLKPQRFGLLSFIWYSNSG